MKRIQQNYKDIDHFNYQDRQSSSQKKIPQSPFSKYCNTLSPIPIRNRENNFMLHRRNATTSVNRFTKPDYQRRLNYDSINSGKQQIPNELNFDFYKQDEVSPIKTVSAYPHPRTENFIVDPKLNDMDNSFSNLICPERLQSLTAQMPPRNIVLMSGTQLLLSPGNPTKKIIFYTEPPKRQRQRMQKFSLQ